MKKLLLMALTVMLLLPVVSLAQVSKPSITMIDSQEMPGLATLVSGGNKIEYRMTASNSGQVPFIGRVSMGLTGLTTTCDGVLANDPVMPGTAEWQVDIGDEFGEAILDAPVLCPGGGKCFWALPDETFDVGQSRVYTVIVVVPQVGLSGDEELTLHAILEDASTASESIINVDCEDIKVITPGGMIVLEFIQVLLVGGGAVASILGALGIFI